MDRREERARTFDGVAEQYAAARPGYPDVLFDDVLTLGAVPPGGRALEVGAGTGQATLPLAKRGLDIVALEPGRRLAAVGRRRLEGFERVTFVESRLEDWRAELDAFDLVVSAEAWHWIADDVGLRVAHACLRSTGAIALMWNIAVDGPGSTPFLEALQRPYVRWAPDLVKGFHLSTVEEADGRGDALAETALFRDLVVRRYPWRREFDAARYVDLIRTYSDHILLPPAAAAGLYADIIAVVDHEFGGAVALDLVTVLKVARRA